MMSVTHAAIAAATTSISLGTANSFVLGAAILGSQLPDLDSTESFVGRMVYPIARWIEERFPHRTVTHSFLSTGIVAIGCSPLLFFCHWHYWAAIVIGQFCGWFSDSFTRAGVAAFYPSPARLVIPGNPRARLKSQSPAEYWVLSIAAFVAVASINLTSAGGITEQFALYFMADGGTAAQMFHKHGSQQTVLVEVDGLNVHTSQKVSGQFTVIEATDSDVIAQGSDGKLYKIGTAPDAQIQPIQIKTQLGDRVHITAQEVALQEIGIRDWVGQLPPVAYVSGSLLLDDSNSVNIPTEIQTYPTIRMFGGQVVLSNARPSQLMALQEFWILSGKAIVKVRAA
jgi:inner membrane protein